MILILREIYGVEKYLGNVVMLTLTFKW